MGRNRKYFFNLIGLPKNIQLVWTSPLNKKAEKVLLCLEVEPFLGVAWAGRSGVGWPASRGEWAHRPAPGTGTASQLQLDTVPQVAATEERTARTEPSPPTHHRAILIWGVQNRNSKRWCGRWKDAFFQLKYRLFMAEKVAFVLESLHFGSKSGISVNRRCSAHPQRILSTPIFCRRWCLMMIIFLSYY